MLVVWTMLAGCGFPEEPLRSQPTEPTVSLKPAEEPPGIVWSDLAGLFPEAGPALPAPLAGLVPGQPADAALAVLEAARHPGGRIRTTTLGGHPVVHAVLRDRPDVAVSLVLDKTGATLEQVNIALPSDEALAVLGERWGAPTMTSGPNGTPVPRWSREGAAWAAQLEPAEPGSILAYRAP
jgi:hypothetical protein